MFETLKLISFIILAIAVVGFILEVGVTSYKRWKYKGMGKIEMIDGVIHVDNIRLKNVAIYLDPDEKVVFTNIQHNIDLKFFKKEK